MVANPSDNQPDENLDRLAGSVEQPSADEDGGGSGVDPADVSTPHDESLVSTHDSSRPEADFIFSRTQVQCADCGTRVATPAVGSWAFCDRAATR